MQYLPDIVKFQRQLSEKFHRRLDRDEAETFTLGEFLKEGHYSNNYKPYSLIISMSVELVISRLNVLIFHLFPFLYIILLVKLCFTF